MSDDQQVHAQQMQLRQRVYQRGAEVRIPNSRANIYLVKTAHVIRRNPMEAGPTMVLQRQTTMVPTVKPMDNRMATIVPLR
jgi:hypothetical protein